MNIRDLQNIRNKKTLSRLVSYLGGEGELLSLLPDPKKDEPVFGFIAIRTSKEYTDKYDDFLLHLNGYDLLNVYACTTKAGRFWVYNPITYGGLTGTAVLAPGIYRQAWKCVWTYRFGFKSKELVQVKPVTVGRDGNKNHVIDYTQTQTGYFGIDLHIGGAFLSPIWNWSAGCITVPKEQWRILEPELLIGRYYDVILHEL